MKYSPVLQETANQIYNILNVYTPIEVKDYGWGNYKWTSEFFRWGHLETFCTPKISVLHTVIMPYQNSNAPIFGFDVVEMNDELTTMFLDLTPVDHREFPVPQVGTPRKDLPDWATMFSPNFLSCKPAAEDLQAGVDLMKAYMFEFLPSITTRDYSNKQQEYIEGQRKNDTTLKTLRSLVGDDIANEFFTEVLFPDVV